MEFDSIHKRKSSPKTSESPDDTGERMPPITGQIQVNVLAGLEDQCRRDGGRPLRCFVREQLTIIGVGEDPRGNKWRAHPGLVCCFIQVQLEEDVDEFFFDDSQTTIWTVNGSPCWPFGTVFFGSSVVDSPTVTVAPKSGAKFEGGRVPYCYGIAVFVPANEMPVFALIEGRVRSLELVDEAVSLSPEADSMSFNTSFTLNQELVHADRVGALDGWQTMTLPAGESGIVARRFEGDTGIAAYRHVHPSAPEGVTVETKYLRAVSDDGESHPVIGTIHWVGSAMPDYQGPQEMSGKLGLGNNGLSMLYNGLTLKPRAGYDGPYSVCNHRVSKLVLVLPAEVLDRFSSLDTSSGFVATDSG